MALSLKNKKSFILVALVSIMLVSVQCNQSATTKEKIAVAAKDSAECMATKPLNPNGDSELALLMRSMVHSSESLKDLIKHGKLPDRFPEEFLKIHTAKPTDSTTKKASFDGYARNYISNLVILFKSPKEQLETNYNGLISACVSCHTEHCPGPLKAIKKLSI